MARLRLVFSGLLVLLAFAPFSRAGDDGVDLAKISPEELIPADTGELVAKANAAYQAKDYETAARTYIQAIRRNPGDANSIYNLACCYGLMGMQGQAAGFLLAAGRAGFDDLEHAKNDPDFDRVRESEPFKAAMTKLTEAAEKRRRTSGERHAVVARLLAEYRIVKPTVERDPWEPVPLVIALHGYGDNAENFAGVFVRRGIPQPFLYCAIQAPYPFTAGARGVGASWELNGVSDEAEIRSDALSEQLVLGVLADLERQYRIDERRIFLMGFSQGAGLAFRIGVRHPERFAGVIPIGGWLVPGQFPVATMEKLAKRGLFLVCHSEEDRTVPFSAAKSSTAELTKFHVPFRLLTYKGGHSLPKELMEQVAAWIADPKPAAPGEK